MKKLTILLGCLMLMFAFSSQGMAEENAFNKLLKGTYEMTGHSVCSYGLTSSRDISRQSTVTYNGDGTGNSEGYGLIITMSGNSFRRYVKCDFTYNVNPDGKSFTKETTCVSFPPDGQYPRAEIFGIVTEGEIGAGHQILILKDTSLNVEQMYLHENEDQVIEIERICGRSEIEIKVR